MQKPLLALALVSAALCAEARAQTQYTVFVHGLGQTGDNWNALAGDLAARHPLSPLQPTLGSGSLFEAQAGVLRNYLDGWNVNGIAAISHSNGGLVVREYVRTTVAPRINRHLSLGTPHQGAALADHIRNGDVSGWAGSIIGYILDPIVYYASNDPDWWDLFFDHGSSSYFYDASYAVSDLLDSPSFPNALTAIGFLLGSNWDWPEILPEMSPYSSFISTLNSSGTLANEAQKLPSARVSISSQYPPELLPWRTFTDDYGAEYWESIHQDLMNLAMDAYWYYSSHENFDLQANAYRWEDMFYALLYIPSDWQYFTGTSYSGQSDGIVPWVSSDYPGGTRNPPYRLLCSTLCIYHVAQLDAVPNHDADAFRVLVSQAVREDLGIKVLAIVMNGPSVAAPDQTLTWTAAVSGGLAPYALQWYVDGAPAGNNQSLTLTTGGNSFNLQVDVTDAVNATKSATKFVSVEIAPPTSCQLEWISYPRYLKVTWVNSSDPGVSTEVQIMKDGGPWTLVGTAAPGSTQFFYTVGSQTGLFDARVRHVKQGGPPSAYCNTNGVTV